MTVHGLDLSLAYYPSERWNLSANYSWVDNNLFEDLGGIGDIALNAPKNKFKVAANYEFSQWGLQLGGRLRYNGVFPMQSGVFAGDVDSYKVVDLNLVYQLPVAQDLAHPPQLGQFAQIVLQCPAGKTGVLPQWLHELHDFLDAASGRCAVPALFSAAS